MNKNLEEYLPDGNKAQYRFMKYRIHKILLVCCSYDGYILEEDGHIESQINQQYLDLNMSNPPSFTRVSSTREALELLGRDDSFDFILTMYNVGELDVFSFAKIVKERHAQIPVALLTSFSKDIYRRLEEQDRSGLDYIFGWHGNTDLIMAIIKLVEDKMNAEEDITEDGQLLVVNAAEQSCFVPDVQELDDYLTACALSLSDTDTYELLSAEENEEYSKNLSYPVYIVTYTAGENEDTREWTVFAMDTDVCTYLYGFCALPDAAADMSEIYQNIFSQLSLSDEE